MKNHLMRVKNHSDVFKRFFFQVDLFPSSVLSHGNSATDTFKASFPSRRPMCADPGIDGKGDLRWTDGLRQAAVQTVGDQGDLQGHRSDSHER